MKSAPRPLLRYFIALALTALVTLVVFSLRPFLSRGFTLFYIPAVMISAWYGGLGPGLLSTFLSVGVTDFFFMDPPGSFLISKADDLSELVVFSFVALVTSVLHTAQKRSQAALIDNQEKVRLVFDVTSSANEAETAGHAIRFALRRFCEDGRWSYAHLYGPGRADAGGWTPASHFHTRDDERFRALRAATCERALRKGEGPAGLTLENGRVEWLDDLRSHPCFEALAQAGARTAAAFPVRVGNETVAVFEAFSLENIEKSGTMMHLMGVVGLELGRVVERQRLQEEYSEAVWEQQRAIARELHDGLGQQLTALGFHSQSLVNRLKNTPEEKSAARVTEGVLRALEQVRDLAKGVSPVAPDAEGLMSALRLLSEATSSAYPIDCRFGCPQPVFVESNQTAVHLFRIAQEAVTNAVKHGHPSRISILLETTEEGLVISVADDGAGFVRKGAGSEGSGLRIMRYRAAAIGASFRIEAAVGGGTRVTCILADASGKGASKVRA